MGGFPHLGQTGLDCCLLQFPTVVVCWRQYYPNFPLHVAFTSFTLLPTIGSQDFPGLPFPWDGSQCHFGFPHSPSPHPSHCPTPSLLPAVRQFYSTPPSLQWTSPHSAQLGGTSFPLQCPLLPTTTPPWPACPTFPMPATYHPTPCLAYHPSTCHLAPYLQGPV